MQASILNKNNDLVNRLFPILIFLASFLSFSIQPFFSKLLLPQFGGSAMVWTTSSLFFQIVLLLSYAYVFILERLEWKKRLFLHVLVGGAVLTLTHGVLGGATLSLVQLPALVSQSASQSEWLQIIWIGLSSVGLAFFFLGTVSTFLQVFAANYGLTNPYTFYRASNFGSFIGLFSYPFLIEPLIPAKSFITAWSAGFTLLSLVLLGIVFSSLRLKKQPQKPTPLEPPSLRVCLSWIGLAAYPVALFLAATNQVTIGIAPVPYLWILPFGMYLLSYILAFGVSFQNSLFSLASLVLGITTFLTILKANANLSEYILQTSLLLCVTFFFSLIFHSIAYSTRPSQTQLGYFYLCLALGGMVGGLFVSVLAPLVFKTYFELELLLTIGMLFSLFIYFRQQPASLKLFGKELLVTSRRASYGLLVCFTLFTLLKALQPGGDVIYRTRNFYGTLKVVDEGNVRSLLNGTILHGSQYLDERSTIPTSYYSSSSGVAHTISYFRNKRGSEPLSIGVIGLGVGNLAAYCQPQDLFIFYEINKQVLEVANQYFTYLKNCSGSEVRLGDARRVIAAEQELSELAKYDVLVIDAFTDDAIPTHLLTKEAGELYLDKIKEDGAIVYHVSNRYLDLEKVIFTFAELKNLYSKKLEPDIDESTAIESQSNWVLVTRSQEDAETIAQLFPPQTVSTKKVLWTDEFANMLAVVKFE